MFLADLLNLRLVGGGLAEIVQGICTGQIALLLSPEVGDTS